MVISYFPSTTLSYDSLSLSLYIIENSRSSVSRMIRALTGSHSPSLCATIPFIILTIHYTFSCAVLYSHIHVVAARISASYMYIYLRYACVRAYTCASVLVRDVPATSAWASCETESLIRIYNISMYAFTRTAYCASLNDWIVSLVALRQKARKIPVFLQLTNPRPDADECADWL